MTNEERLAQVQAIEYRERHMLLSLGAVIILVLVVGIGYFGSSFIKQRIEAARIRAEEEARAAARPGIDALTHQSLAISSQTNIISQITTTRVEEAKQRAQQEAEEALLASQCPDGYAFMEYDLDQIHKGELQLINKDHEYYFLESDLLSLLYDQIGGNYYLGSFNLQLTKNTADHLHQMLAGYYEATGDENILVLSGYRSKEESDDLYSEESQNIGSEYADSYTMQGGFSEHHSGMAVDIGNFSTGSYIHEYEDNVPWFFEHACEYGFILRYPESKQSVTGIAYEDWHFRYLGVPVATDIYNKKLCLEEWIENIHEYSVRDPYLITLDDGSVYEAYYVPGTQLSENGLLNVPVPEGREFTVSGDNVDGVIVVSQR
ncbi:MAG: M15 family metallopeptidase [Firmicutes bacterium]|nr:M15 family metallopeptidase [Bacillota bacterium]